MFDTYIFRNLGHTFENIDDLYNYLLQGKAVISIISSENDCSEYCYTCLKPFKDGDNSDRIFVYHIVTYNHNNSVYLGMLKDDTFTITSKSIYGETHPAAINFKQIWSSARSQDKFEANKDRIKHLGRCCYCGKKLVKDNDRLVGYHSDCRQSNYLYSPANRKANNIMITAAEVMDECPFTEYDHARPTINIQPRKRIKPVNTTTLNQLSLGEQFTQHAEEIESDPNYWEYLIRQI